MSEQGYEYDQYTPQTGGRLFSSSMFGFNKEEVLEYLDELADENYQRQEAADLQIQELTQQMQALEANLQSLQQAPPQVDNSAIEALQQQINQLAEELDIAKAATQQAEEDLAETREVLHNAQQENGWLREEYQKSDVQLSDLRRQLDNMPTATTDWDGKAEAEARLAEAETRLAETETRAAEAETRFAQAEAHSSEAEAQVEELRQQLATATGGQWAGMEEADKKLAELAHKLQEAERRLAEVTDKLSEAARQNEDLTERIRQAEAKQALAIQDAEDAARRADEAVARLAEANDKAQMADQRVAEAHRQTEEANSRLTQLRQEAEQLASTAKQSAAAAAQPIIDEAERKAEDAEVRLAQALKRADDATHQARAAAMEAEDANSRTVLANAEIDELKQQLEKAQAFQKAGERTAAASAAIIADANAEAERIRATAMEEKERIRRQIKSSAGGLAESITNLRGDLTGVENDVTSVLEAMQTALADILAALGRTEQNLNTLGVQVERFPATSASVPKPQQVVYFQPSEEPMPASGRRSRKAAPAESLGQSGFRRLTPEAGSSNIRPFRPTYSSSPTAPALELSPEEDTQDDRMRALAENLVDTLVQMMT